MDIVARLEQLTEAEKKRREKAIELLVELEETLADYLNEIQGCTTHGVNDHLYFRSEYRERDGERIGFHYKDRSEEAYFYELNSIGEVAEMKGPKFWNAIQEIIPWLKEKVEKMEKAQESREKVLSELEKVANHIVV
ncbi:hypothetical protein [Aneurinibacillus danicus]|jgi:hypothetical protein|uniref:Uncharacterized protein n=1 Tax=Aneurinibacillus danicus TaxID=267746 RepID=A0A511VEN1_9BACL|nr:hypothetical protein [Aneurinibacillus danicus]GEN36881.1 hypothetical protein ADA01nite_43410 [Aneurinibacillus danicus]